MGLKLSEALPDETTILNFRHLLERQNLGQGLFQEINRHLESQGLRLREGTIVDASIIEAPYQEPQALRAYCATGLVHRDERAPRGKYAQAPAWQVR